jgi:hypothetical protein
MDISVLAAVGSFVVSEQVLKPKATLLVILGCVLAYDLTSKTHDPSSLRVYRGPALLAVTLMMVAYSLRTWRRNGIACDELLFLPGTQHAEETTTSSTSINNNNNTGRTNNNISSAQEGDAAAGFTRTTPERISSAASMVAQQSRALPRTGSGVSSTNQNTQRSRQSRNFSMDDNNSLSSIREFANTWDEDDDESDHSEDDTARNHEQVALVRSTDSEVSVSNAASGISSSLEQQSSSPFSQPPPLAPIRNPGRQITRIGSFFFFRSNTSSSTSNAAYAPSGPSVVGAALDLSMPVLFNFHLFIEAFNHMGDSTPAKILPLIFLSVLIVRAFFPFGRRARFWSTIKYTFMAPFQKSLLRDLFLGDVLTSLVRPGQDVLFALSYYVTVIAGTVSGQYGLNTSGKILESSWILHNVVLPSCALLPLWFRFLQTLREAYDHDKRWPYFGNSFKYLMSAGVILFGMVHSENRRGPAWLLSFAVCVIYQIWFDVVYDWELLVYAPNEEGSEANKSSNNGYCARISSVNPNNRLLLLFQQYYFQPVCDCMSYFFRTVCRRIPSWRHIHLRPKRLYKSDAFYWGILAYNVVFRFAWMLCFIPAYHLSPSGRHHITTFSSDTNSYVGVLLPVAEILRRTFWGFLYLEVQTIKSIMDDKDMSFQSNGDMTLDDNLDASEGSDSSYSSKPRRSYAIAENLTCYQRIRQRLRCDREMRRKLFVAELSLWAVAFVSLAMWATN